MLGWKNGINIDNASLDGWFAGQGAKVSPPVHKQVMWTDSDRVSRRLQRTVSESHNAPA